MFAAGKFSYLAVELFRMSVVVFMMLGGVASTPVYGPSWENSTSPILRPITNTERLMKDLLTGYNVDVRPVYNQSQATDLTMLLLVSHILDLDERMQKLKINGWVTFIWKDEFLTWDPASYGGLERLKIPSGKIWLPEVVLYNNADDGYTNFLHDHIVKVDHNGTVLWAAPTIFHSKCQLDVRNFPFDEQICPLKFGPWQYSGEEILLHGEGDGEAHGTVFTSDGEWDMVGFAAMNHISYYPDDPGVPFSDVRYDVCLRRRPLFHVINLILPCALLSVVIVFIFVLPVESGEKISFGITILLSLTVFLLLLAESMPPSSVIPLVGQFYAVILVLVTISVSSSAVIVNLHHSGPERSEVPRWVKKWILRRLGDALGLKLGIELAPLYNEQAKFPRTNGMATFRRTSLGAPSPLLDRRALESETCFNSSTESALQRRSSVHGDCRDSALLQEVRELRKMFANRESGANLQHEWRLVALVLDRLFLTIYVTALALTIIAGIVIIS